MSNTREALDTLLSQYGKCRENLGILFSHSTIEAECKGVQGWLVPDKTTFFYVNDDGNVWGTYVKFTGLYWQTHAGDKIV